MVTPKYRNIGDLRKPITKDTENMIAEIKDCSSFLQWALPKMKMRWRGFRKVKRQVCKRLLLRMQELHIHNHQSYREFLDKHPQEWEKLEKLTHISISRFFRDYKSWEMLGKKLLPSLAANAARHKRDLNCWSAGCASGEEPYSLALLWNHKLASEFPGLTMHILATDADEHLLQRAWQSCYPESNVKHVPKEWFQKSFQQQEKDIFCLDKNICQKVDFKKQDIRKEMPEGPFDLVFCKNLVGMYFVHDQAVEIFNKISIRMQPAGILMLGNHEPFPEREVDSIYVFNRGLNIYQKKG